MVLEFYGTAMGIWHWATILPGTSLPAANPPAAIGAGYCVLDAVAACLVQRAAGKATAAARAVCGLDERHARDRDDLARLRRTGTLAL